MHKLKQVLRTSVFYMTAMVLVGGIPMAAFADKSDACIAAGHTGGRWVTDPSTGQCVKAKTLPAPEQSPAPVPAETTPPVAPEQSPAPTTTQTDETSTGASDTSAGTSGTSGSTTVDAATDVTTDTTVNNNNKVTNEIDATSKSGDALVAGNGSGGNAGTGNSTTQATVVNSVHSTVDGTTGVAHFSTDINGNVTGDITIGPASGNTDVNSTTNLSGTTNVNNNTQLQNDINLTAASGDATVRGNESSGNATTGNANVVANIMNLINTIIAANQSFVGTINIYGNLNGDILISPDFIPQLIASNATTTITMPLATKINDDQSIVNNVKLDATTGTAKVSGNEATGSATTGNAQTNLTVLNLTGHTVNAANSVLVFVNVLGTWVGLIVDAPGATAAALGSGITTNTQANISSDTNINNNASITNNLDLAALSGNATVRGNESSGNAATGNATASANIANISTSTFNLTGWFGILFINVFGSWVGSFGVDTSAGTVVPLTGSAAQSSVPGAPNMRFGFTPQAETASKTSKFSALGLSDDGAGGTGGAFDQADGAITDAAKNIAAAMQPSVVGTEQPVLAAAPSPRVDPFSVLLMTTGFSIAGISGILWVVRRWLSFRSAAAI